MSRGKVLWQLHCCARQLRRRHVSAFPRERRKKRSPWELDLGQ